MTGISKGTKVYAERGERWFPGVIISHHFASSGMYDLFTLRIAEYSQATQGWQLSEYGPVSSSRLTKRETHIPGLDLDEKSHPQRVPQWVWQLQD
jgi:hypothetical protein